MRLLLKSVRQDQFDVRPLRAITGRADRIGPMTAKGRMAGFRGATFETSRRLSKPLNFRSQIDVAKQGRLVGWFARHHLLMVVSTDAR